MTLPETVPGSFEPLKFEKYIIEKPLGQGGMGQVFLAYNPQFPNRPIAIKVLPQKFSENQMMLARFKRERDITDSLSRLNVVTIYDYGEQDERPFLVMEFMPGGTLRDKLRKQGAFSPEETAALLEKLAPTLDEMHRRGIMHRDLKPSNILFDSYDQPVIADFGIAKRVGEESAQLTQLTIGLSPGTPAYMSPEQRQYDEVDHRSDLYTMAVILHELLTTQLPSATYTPHHLPKAVQQWLANALALNPNKRYGSAKEMAAALKTAVSQSSKSGMSRRLLLVSGLGVLLLAACALGWQAFSFSFASLQGDEPDSTPVAIAPPDDVPDEPTLTSPAPAATEQPTEDADEPAVIMTPDEAPDEPTLTAPAPTSTVQPEDDGDASIVNIPQPVIPQIDIPSISIGEFSVDDANFPESGAVTLTESGRFQVGALFNEGVFSPNGRYFALPVGTNLQIIDLEQQAIVNRITLSGITTDIAFAADGQEIVVSNIQDVVRRWSVLEGELLSEQSASAFFALAADFSADQNLLAGVVFADSGGDQPFLQIWQADIDTALIFRAIETDSPIDAIRFSPDDELLAIRMGSDIQIRTVFDGGRLKTLEGASAGSSLAFSSDGTFVVAGGANQKVSIWQLSDGELLTTYEGHDSSVSAVAINADGSVAASGDNAGNVHLWATATGERLDTLAESGEFVTFVAFDGAGEQLVAGWSDGLVLFWDVE